MRAASRWLLDKWVIAQHCRFSTKVRHYYRSRMDDIDIDINIQWCLGVNIIVIEYFYKKYHFLLFLWLIRSSLTAIRVIIIVIIHLTSAHSWHFNDITIFHNVVICHRLFVIDNNANPCFQVFQTLWYTLSWVLKL